MIYGGDSRKFTAISGIHINILFLIFPPVGRNGECCEILGMYTELIQNFFLAGWAGLFRGILEWRKFMHL